MLKSYFEVEAHDENFGYLRTSRKRRSRSFVQGFLKLHYPQLISNTAITITNIAGASCATGQFALSGLFRATHPGRTQGSISSRALFTTYMSSVQVGIVLGTGTTSVTPTDFALATIIADGTSSSQLEYLSSSGSGLTISAPSGSFTLERLFRNSSGGTITVNEVGVYSTAMDSTTSPENNGICIIRDIVSPGFAINDGEYARVIYTLSITA